MRLSQAGKLSCLLEEGVGEVDDGGSWRSVNVCRCEQGGQGRAGQVKCGDVQEVRH